MAYEISTIAGDGIGPEVIDSTLPLFETVADESAPTTPDLDGSGTTRDVVTALEERI